MADKRPLINRYADLSDNHVKTQVPDFTAWRPFTNVVLPRQLEIHLSNNRGTPCNFRCDHCQGQSLIRDVAPYDDKVIPLIDRLQGRIPLFVLSGAYTEPFLNDNIIKYIAVIKKWGSFFGLHSNGSFLARDEAKTGFITEMVARSTGDDYFTCAADAATAPTFARLKKTKVAVFDRVWQGLRILADEKRKYSDGRVKLRFTYLLNEENSSVEELQQMVRLARGVDATSLRFSIPYAPYGTDMAECEAYRTGVEIPLKRSIWENVQQVLSNEERAGETYVFAMAPGFQDIKRLTFQHCFYGYFQITLGADGYFYRCSAVASPLFKHLRLGPVTDNVDTLLDIIRRNQVVGFNPQTQCFPHSGRCNRASIDVNDEYESRYYTQDDVCESD
jgi:MoaA/NifB/PqqE/SkfB family radical SAM enzyme